MTLHYRVGNHLALEGNATLVAKESTGTSVPVVEGYAILIGNAFAVDGEACASAVLATVVDGAGVAIIAIIQIKLPGATAQSVANIVGTGIIIVACNGQTDAFATLTMVSNGARISINALTLLHHFMLAAFLGQAKVNGTGNAVIAEPNGGVNGDVVGFVNVAIAIIVDTVANLFGRNRRITGREPLLCAHSFARAGAEFIAHFTVREEPQSCRLQRAGTLSCIGQTLQHGDTIYRLGLYTGEAPGTLVIGATESTAETPRRAVVKTDVLGAANPVAIEGINTRFAKLCVTGQADPCEVRGAGTGLLAQPTWRALFLTELSADTLSHMLDTPSFKTIFIGVTWVKEATGPWLTSLIGNLQTKLTSLSDKLTDTILVLKSTETLFLMNLL